MNVVLLLNALIAILLGGIIAMGTLLTLCQKERKANQRRSKKWAEQVPM